MVFFDVNVLIFAYRAEAAGHTAYRRWLDDHVEASQYGVSDVVLSGVIRLLTHPKIYREPTPLETALEYVDWIRHHPNCLLVSPGPRHWQIFTGLCRAASVRGAMVTDAYFAALAIESGAEWITTDRDYARFPGLRWRHPLA